MVDGDDRRSAAAEADLLDDRRTTCFWDPERRVGLAWGEHYRTEHLPQVLADLAADDPMRPLLEERAAAVWAMWDIACFYAAGARWPAQGIPSETRWTKQFEFGFDESGQPAGGFFRGTEETAETSWSCWAEEFAAGMAAIGG